MFAAKEALQKQTLMLLKPEKEWEAQSYTNLGAVSTSLDLYWIIHYLCEAV